MLRPKHRSHRSRVGYRGIIDALIDAAVDEPQPLDMLLADLRNLKREKWDLALPDGPLRKA